MKHLFEIFISILVLSSCSQLPLAEVSRPEGYVFYSVDHVSPDFNSMDVTLSVPLLGNSNDIFQFASTAPGTYQVMDIGRFVSDFRVFDAKGRKLDFTRISTNQFKLHDPARVRSIHYRVAETWDTKVDSNKIYRMCGTSVEEDHVLFNAHCVLGYFKGLQAMPIQLRLRPNEGWLAGTALEKDAAGNYLAKNFDHLVDSPVLMGRLSRAATNVNGTVVEIFSYSKTDRIRSEQILASMESMLKAADKFLYGLPVDRYTFLFHFENSDHGAWEHSYSSEYVYREDNWKLLEESVMATASHEFFHIVTPLTIHSEIIEQFNFEQPTPSQHLWLYEGVTEWASDMMLLQAGLIGLPEYLDRQEEKLILDNMIYDQEYSLTDLAMISYTPKGQKQFGNIYNAGALTAGLLDILLIDASGGERGLRELIVELAEDYGPERPFSEDGFFAELTERTFPGTAYFIDKYIKGRSPLPLKEYYNKIGIDYLEISVDSSRSGIGIPFLSTNSGLLVTAKPELPEPACLEKMDFITAINGVSVNEHTIGDYLKIFEELPVGTLFDIEFFRGSEAMVTQCHTVMKRDFQTLEITPNITGQQQALRDKWMNR